MIRALTKFLRQFSYKNSKFKILCFFVMAFILSGIFFLANIVSATSIFSDNFTSNTNNWTPSSGAWVGENSEYQQKEIGKSFSTQGAVILNEDFSTPASTITSTDTPFSDNFTESDGLASQWSVKKGTLAISGNEYLASAGSTTLSIPTTDYSALSDYRITTRIKREGAADAAGYSLLYFRLTMADATNDNSYALLFRQTGYLELYKRVNGAYSGSYLSRIVVPKDNDFHDVIVTVVGSTIKVWFDKSETQVPDMVIINTTYATGTVGVGTTTWASRFDNIQVDNLQVSSTRWTEKRGAFYTSGGEYYSFSSSASYPLSIPTDASFINWDNYKISAKIKREGAADAAGYSLLYFRLTMADATNDNSYALLFRQTGYLELYKRVNGAYSGSYLSRIVVPKDNDFHDVIVTVVGSTIKVWFDKSDGQIPDIEIGDTSYLTGTIGVGTNLWNSRFDDIVVKQVLTIEPKPSHLYSDSTTNLTFTTGSNLDNLNLTITNPAGTSWNLSNPSGCAGNKTCTVIFPTAFTGANLNTLGTYKISATNGDDTASVLLEVKEKPLLSFIDITDTHTKGNGSTELNEINNFISDINNNYYFPAPDFVVLTGDLADSGGTVGQLTDLKSSLDTLNVPYYPVVGGHDSRLEIGGDQGHIWADTFGMDKFTYSWTVGDFLFLAMDAEQTYSGYGYDLNSSEHKTWLQNILTANPDKKVILFSHFGLNAVRDGGDAADFWQGEIKSAEVRSILESQGNVIAQFSGHSHVNGMSALNGIHYFQTAGFTNTDEYRYIEVYSDHIESTILKKQDYRYGVPADYWPGSTDSTHTASNYSYGLPDERQFKIDYATKNLDILDGISVAGNSGWEDYTYQADVTLGKEDFVGENVAGIIFRYVDSNNYYLVSLDSASDVIKLFKKQNGIITNLISQSTVVDQNTAYTVRAVIQGDNIEVYLDDVLKIDTTDSTFSSGKIGLETYLANTTYDNISVTNLTLPSLPTPSVTDISTSTVTLNGSIDDMGGDTATARGFEYGLTDSYGTVISTSGTYDTGAFTGAITSLSCNTIYHFRSFATNSVGTTYSVDTSFNTYACTPSNLSASLLDSSSMTLTVDSFLNDTSVQSGYYFSRSGANSGWIQTNSWVDTGLSCGRSYDYSVIYRNGDGVETGSISTSQSTSGCNHGGSRLFIAPSIITPPTNQKNVPGCDSRNTGFSTSTGQSCAGNIINTLSKTYNLGNTTLKNGSKGEAVKELQRFLNDELNLGLVIDGKLGPKTIAVIKKWQKANGLVADGLVGTKTKAKINTGSK